VAGKLPAGWPAQASPSTRAHGRSRALLRLAAAQEAKAEARGGGSAPIASAREGAAGAATARAAFGLRAPPPGAPPAAADSGDGLGGVGLRQSSGEVGRGRGSGHGCREPPGVAIELGGTAAALGNIKCGWLLKQMARPAPHRPAPHRAAPRRTAPPRAAPRRTAPHRAAPRLTAPRRTSPHRAPPHVLAPPR
jgi:hypothetical protein